MNKFLLAAALVLWCHTIVFSQTSNPFPPGHSCEEAPLICGSFLNGYEEATGFDTIPEPAGLDTLLNCSLQDARWLRIIACGDSLSLDVEVPACTAGSGIELALLAGDSCGDLQVVTPCQLFPQGDTLTFTATGLTPGATYYLLIDGADGAECAYRLSNAFGLAGRDVVVEQVEEPAIDGPSVVCRGDVADYTFSPGLCEIIDTADCQGNPQAPTASCAWPDSSCLVVDTSELDFCWQVVGGTFIGDSCNVLNVQVMWGDTTDGLLFIVFDDPDQDTIFQDGPAYCCNSCGGCNVTPPPFPVGIIWNVQEETHLLCPGECIELCGEIYCQEGQVICPDSCGETIHTIEFIPPEIEFLGEFNLCEIGCFDWLGQVYCDPGNYVVPEDPFEPCTKFFEFELVEEETPLQVSVAEICSPDGSTFDVVLDIAGGTPPYLVNGIPVAGNNWVEGPFPNGSFYDLIVSSEGFCPQQLNVVGQVDCPECEKKAGNLTVNYNCVENGPEPLPQGNAVLKSGDVLAFALTSGPNFNSSTVIQWSSGAPLTAAGPVAYGTVYYLYAVVAEDNGAGLPNLNDPCRDVSEPVMVQFFPPLILALQTDTDLLSCQDSTATLEAQIEGGSGNFDLQWNTGLSDVNTLTTAAAGNFTLTVQDLLTGCSIEAEQPVEAVAPPQWVELEWLDPTCFGFADGEILPGDIQGGKPPFTFLLNGQSTSLQGLPAGSYLLAVEDALGCRADTQLVLQQPDSLAVDLGEDLEAIQGQPVRLTFEANFQPQSIRWSENGNVLAESGKTLDFEATQTASYTVQLTAANGCIVSDQLLLQLEELRLKAPNIFSPNGDGTNDFFTLFADETGIDRIESLQIFSRWGELVYERRQFSPNEPTLGWDGRYQGKEMPPDVFVFVAEVSLLNGESISLKGDVTLVR